VPSARSMGSANVIGNSVFIWGGYCGGVLPHDEVLNLSKLNYHIYLFCCVLDRRKKARTTYFSIVV